MFPLLLGACQAAAPDSSWPLGSLLPDACNRNHQRVSSSLCLPTHVNSAQPKRTPQRAVHPNATFLFRDTLELKIPRELENRTNYRQAPCQAHDDPLGECEDAGKGISRGGNDITVIIYTKLSQISLFHQRFSFGSHSLLPWGGRPSAKRNTASMTLGQLAGKAEAANTRKATEQHRTTESLRYSSRQS